MTLRKSAFAAVRWTSMAMMGRAIIAFAQIVILSRLLDPADFKLVAIAITIVNVGVLFTDMGLSNALISFRDVTDSELSSLFWLNVLIGAAMTAAVAAGSPLIASFYGDARLVPLILTGSSAFFITSLGQQQRALAEKHLRFDLLFWIDVGSALVALAVAVAMALAGFGAGSIVLGNVVNATGVAALSWLLLADGWRPRLELRLASVRRFLAFGANVIGVQLFNALALNGDVILGGRLLPGATLGYYFQPRDLCMRIMFVVNPIVTRVSFPLLASIAHDKAKVRSVYLKAMNMTASVNFPIYAFLAVFSPEVVAIVLGPKWEASAPIMRALTIWCAVRSVGNPVGSLMFATGATRRAMMSSALVALAVFACTAIGGSFGVVGIPVALTALYAMLIPAFWAFLIRPTCGAGFVEYHKTLLWPALTTFCAVAAALAVLPFLDGPLPRLILGGAAGVLSYLASSWFINRDWLTSMAELLMVRRLRSRMA